MLLWVVMMSPSATVCDTDEFLIVFGHSGAQWQREISYVGLWLTKRYFLVRSIHCRGFFLIIGFVDSKKTIEYQQTYPLTQSTSNFDAKFMKQSLPELCKRHDEHVCCDSYKNAQYPSNILDCTNHEVQQPKYCNTAAITTNSLGM